MSNCVFCNIKPEFYLAENDLCYAIKDLHPKSKGHTLIISKRHVPNYFGATDLEIVSMKNLANIVKDILKKEDETIEGYNVVCNVGEIAGQTIHHLHMHIIPRRKDDGLRVIS